MTTPAPGHAVSRGGFTLIELLVVIGIIGVLVAFVLAVGARVSGAGKERATEQVLRALDLALGEYIATKGVIPPPTILDPRRSGNVPNEQYLWPVADARNMGSSAQETINSAALFLLQGRGLPAVEAAQRSIDPRFLRAFDPDAGSPTDWFSQPELLTPFDAWGNPIRYVHPRFHGLLEGSASDPPGQVALTAILGQPPAGRTYCVTAIRRSNRASAPDADGGLCTAGRPYFYSAGPDAQAATVEDNLYIHRPQVQKN